ncbi:MAG TPA: DNA cytosine methyltransferase, partial [Burkholderiaceae bacterium]|nr:DNA cytosine methyltransferase [Burkholderiaceae bacterium]
MPAYYNEIDPKAAAWLRELIKQGHIADGVVDERSIVDVSPDELRGFTQCHFFAGIGVWSYALRSAGWSDDRPVWTGSCPCQPFSSAGRRGGVADERHLWPHWHHLISQCQPPIVFGEQVASKDGLGWLDLVSTDMEATGYAFGAADLCAAGVGAPHIRQRLFFGAVRLADAAGVQRERKSDFRPTGLCGTDVQPTAGWADDRPVWTGSCPCQPFSSAGRRGGVTDERHLWPHWHHLISQCQPSVVFGEQVASKDGLGWL